jgi:hypothetical protein
MSDINILELIWNSFNEAHIWERHQLTRAEVEEVAYGLPENLYVRRTYGSRFLVIGPKADRRLMVLILAPKGKGNFIRLAHGQRIRKSALSIANGRQVHNNE